MKSQERRGADRGSGAPKLDVVNGWRGYAILAVLMIHSLGRPFPPEAFHVPAGHLKITLGAILNSGWIGVDAFFMASGFVLYLPYANRRREMRRAADCIAFFKRRALRLLPLCFLGSFLPFIMIDFPPISDHRFWIYLVNFPLATFSWIAGYNVMNANGALWSISIEILLSALFPLFVVAVHRWGAFRLFAALAVFYAANREITLLTGGRTVFWPLVAHSSTLQNFLLLSGGDVTWLAFVEFAAGIYFAHLYVNPDLPVINLLRKYSLACFTIGLVVILVFCQLNWHYATARNLGWPTSALDVPLPFILEAGLYLMFAALLFGSNRALHWLFANWAIQLIGAMCYSIYIWHSPLFLKFTLGVNPQPWQHAFAIYIPALALILAFSAFSYRFIEFPNKSLSELFLLGSRPASRRTPSVLPREPAAPESLRTDSD
ncbi:MAG: acyltransferase family protein [Alphaproteobacteria bacterium]